MKIVRKVSNHRNIVAHRRFGDRRTRRKSATGSDGLGVLPHEFAGGDGFDGESMTRPDVF